MQLEMNNTTVSVILDNPEATTKRLVIASAYFINGFFGVILNGLVLLCTVQDKNNQTIILSALASSDLLNAFAYFCYGLRALIVANMATFFMAPFQCMVHGLHITIFEIAEASSSWFTTFVTLDRLIAMVWFTQYRNLGHKYVFFIFGFVSVYTVTDVTLSWVGSYFMEQVKNNPARCAHPASVPDNYYFGHNIQIICCGYLSIIFYICALTGMKMNKNNVSSSVQAAQIKRESTVTKRVARIILMIFVLQIVPLTIYITDLGNLPFFESISPYAWTIYALTPSINVFIYYSGNAEFRLKLKKKLSLHSNKVVQST